jgi:hypothetical protein
MTQETFDTSFGHNDNIIRARHGKIWTSVELHALKELYFMGSSLKEMAEKLQRPADGVISKLSYLRLVAFDVGTMKYYHVGKPTSVQTTKEIYDNLKEETTMSEKTPVIETKTFIAGADAATLSDGDIFRKIGQLEAQIETLNKIKAKPAKLLKVIADTQADIDKLVAFVDARP